ncbi:MAG: lytic transglycosylase domain-containing protein, partial [Clostridiales bacterium]|nr:lytic transglycosylase domain-containing protein [Clostridiales bacterium]
AESSFREDTVSSAGAQGLMQLKPATAAELGVNDSFDAVQNMMGGAKYLRAQVDRFGDLRLALAAYNAGPYAIEELNITDPDDSLQYAKIAANVRDYVSDVMRYYDTFNEQDGQGGA